MDRTRVLTYLFAVNAVAFTSYGVFLTTTAGATLGGILVLVGGVLGLLVTGQQIVRGEYETIEIPTDDTALWLMVVATFCIVVGTSYQIL